jgi:hypothetical protein
LPSSCQLKGTYEGFEEGADAALLLPEVLALALGVPPPLVFESPLPTMALELKAFVMFD